MTEVVLSCDDLDRTLALFTGELGFRVEMIFPADDPAVAVISRNEVRLRLQRGEVEPIRPPIALPPLEASLVFGKRDAPWNLGRAGMRYRDLIPGRQGGRFIASQISVDGGPVADYVHYHKVRFQMIFCRSGWVRLVYEDQGAPFVMHAGDCVLQPPEIRHRVLESSDGLEVIELGCPALHETHADHQLMLPTPELRAERIFSGQRFVFHRAENAAWIAERDSGFEYRDTGIGAATSDLASARVLRPRSVAATAPHTHDFELLFFFVLAGAVTLELDGERNHRNERLESGESVVVPAGMRYALCAPATELELLEVTVAR